MQRNRPALFILWSAGISIPLSYRKPYPVDQSILLATEQDLRTQKHFFDLLPDGEVDSDWTRAG
jgi:hypothetical protein